MTEKTLSFWIFLKLPILRMYKLMTQVMQTISKLTMNPLLRFGARQMDCGVVFCPLTLEGVY